jgi:hypothetical protein
MARNGAANTAGASEAFGTVGPLEESVDTAVIDAVPRSPPVLAYEAMNDEKLPLAVDVPVPCAAVAVVCT